MSMSSNHRPGDQLDIEDDRSRLRVSKACTRCRTRKDRCDGLQPCTACRNANKACVYEATTKKRGLPEGYVRGLEKLLTLASHSIDGLEDVLTGYLQSEQIKRGWTSAVGEELYSQWKDSKLYQELEVFLQNTTANGVPGNKRKRSSEDSDADSPEERLDTILQHLREKEYRVAEGGPVTKEEALHSADEDSPQEVDRLPENSKRLLDLYFAYVNCWFPILNRPVVLKTFYGQNKQTFNGAKPDGGLALLWAIFAYAIVINADHADDAVTLSLRYSETSLKHIPTPYTNAEDVRDFDDMHAQALLVLALLRLGNGQWLGSWNCAGRAARVLLARQAQNPQKKLSNAAQSALQGCFIVETLLNVHFDNSRSLFPSSLLQDMVDEDGHEEWEYWNPPEGSVSSAGPSFALSVFNRMTKVFLILHEALSDPSSASTPEYVQSKLTEIHTLAQEHFSAGIGSPTLHSPPHHVFFQIGLLFAQLRLVSRVSEEARLQFDLTSLATNVLGLFEICEKSHIGLLRVPPLFADILNLATDVAAHARNFGASAASPSYQDFARTMSAFRVRLTHVWVSFRGASEELATTQPPVADTLPVDTTYNLGLSSSEDLLLPVTLTDDLGLPDQWMPPQPQRQHHERPTASLTHPRSSLPRNSFGGSWPVFPPTMGTFPATSPSFQGDEVDAIFHEMAHLDTNEWTSERATGLKDFGFTNESAFMEFCNDPGRLAVPPDGGHAHLSSSRQSWTFATEPP